jgi:RNA polymerase sigma-70 factor (ECF subfamily)
MSGGQSLAGHKNMSRFRDCPQLTRWNRTLDAVREPPNRAPGPLADTISREEGLAFLAKLQQLDRDAWDRFYLQHRRLVRGVVAGYLGYSADLDDVAQQVFMTAVSLVQSARVKLHGDESGLRAWLATIAENLARTEETRRRKSAPGSDPWPADICAGPSPDPVAIQTFRRAQQVLAELPPRLRTPWLLRNLEHMTVDEIAVATGVSAATVKRRLASAAKRFAQLVARDPILSDYLEKGCST